MPVEQRVSDQILGRIQLFSLEMWKSEDLTENYRIIFTVLAVKAAHM